MIIGSVSEDKNLEKRVAITPDIIKKYKLKTKSIEKINKNGLNKQRIKSTQNYFSKAIFISSEDPL